MRDLCASAVDAALAAGASYADARAVSRRSQKVATKKRIVGRRRLTQKGAVVAELPAGSASEYRSSVEWA